MTNDSYKDSHVPEGFEFLQLVWEQENHCELETDKRLPTMGKKAPTCLEQMGTVLSLLDRMASCWWACRKGDHLIEYLCGRVGASVRAALRLMRFGFYDESLALCRGIGETANLLYLFNLDPGAFEEWKTSTLKVRLSKFAPGKVRQKLEELDTFPPINQERYSLFCERAVHVNPGTKPQSHNILGLPIVGATFQGEGMLVCLNELAFGLSLATLFSAHLLNLEKDIKCQIVKEAGSLAEQIGGTTITEIDNYHDHVRKSPEALEELNQIAKVLRWLQTERHR